MTSLKYKYSIKTNELKTYLYALFKYEFHLFSIARSNQIIQIKTNIFVAKQSIQFLTVLCAPVLRRAVNFLFVLALTRWIKYETRLLFHYQRASYSSFFQERANICQLVHLQENRFSNKKILHQYTIYQKNCLCLNMEYKYGPFILLEISLTIYE